VILSTSGWRDIFAEDGEAESHSGKISGFHTFVSAAAALLFVELICKKSAGGSVIVGRDTRPTGDAVARTIIRALLAEKCRVIFCGVTAAPEIMAYARSLGGGADGFIYISASHNPIGYNGIKFGRTDGGVLGSADMAVLEKGFHSLNSSRDAAAQLLEKLNGVAACLFDATLNNATRFKNDALAAYSSFSLETAAFEQECILTELRNAINAAPLGIAVDFNGSARSLSIDKSFFESFGLKFRYINDEAGKIVHQIVPEGEALLPCAAFLDELRRDDPDFTLAYVPDCDGDRGNIVFFDENAGCVRPLEAQEVFALTCLAELCQLAWIDGGGNGGCGQQRKTAVAINDATSMRIDRIAMAFGAEVFRAETGEANVVNLGRRLRAEGWTAPIMGEGAAGGSIVHPSSVRDPLQTVVALLKLLRIRSTPEKKGFFELWLEKSNRKVQRPKYFTLSDIIASLPAFTTTSAYSEDARLKTGSHGQKRLKERYQKIFLRDWEKRKNSLRDDWGLCGWDARAYNDSAERRGIENFGDAERGGLRIVFHNETGAECASLWMRGSGTEPVFRVMADVEGVNPVLHRQLLDWHRDMALEAGAE
jgi:phosphoglucomutase